MEGSLITNYLRRNNLCCHQDHHASNDSDTEMHESSHLDDSSDDSDDDGDLFILDVIDLSDINTDSVDDSEPVIHHPPPPPFPLYTVLPIMGPGNMGTQDNDQDQDEDDDSSSFASSLASSDYRVASRPTGLTDSDPDDSDFVPSYQETDSNAGDPDYFPSDQESEFEYSV